MKQITLLACTFAGLSTVLTFLTLACAGRLVRDFNAMQDWMVSVNNTHNRKLCAIEQNLDSALDSMLALDAETNSTAEVHESAD